MLTSEHTHLQSQVVALIPALRAFARRFHPSKTDADDLVQDTLMKALANLDRFNAGSLKSWMFTIMRNTFCTKFAIARRESPGTGDCVASTSSVAAPQEAAVEMAELGEALDRLPEAQRKLIFDVALHGESYEAAAVRLGCAVGTVKSRLSRAREHLSEELGFKIE